MDFFFFKQKTAYEMRISDWSSDVCSSDLERLVLRYLINQEGIILFMATIGITFFLDGFGQTLWGSDIYEIDLFLPKDPIFLFEDMFPGGLLVAPYELLAAVIAGLLVVVLAVLVRKSVVEGQRGYVGLALGGGR